MQSKKQDWSEPDDPARGVVGGLKDFMDMLLQHFAKDERYCVQWVVDLHRYLMYCQKGGVTKAQGFTIGQFGSVPEEILTQAREGAPGWQGRVRAFLRGVLAKQGLEPQFLEVIDPGGGTTVH